MPIPSHITLLDPWEEISSDHGRVIDSELQCELSPEHVLYGIEAKAIARSRARDDVLFELVGHKYPLAHVHLTWSQKRLQDSRWPKTQFFANWEDWVQEKLIPDHDEYNHP